MFPCIGLLSGHLGNRRARDYDPDDGNSHHRCHLRARGNSRLVSAFLAGLLWLQLVGAETTPMKLLVKLKTGEEGFIVGYAPGRKGRPLAVVVIDEKLRAVKLKGLELVGYVKIRECDRIESKESIMFENGSEWAFH
jgi:hypothetical protein